MDEKDGPGRWDREKKIVGRPRIKSFWKLERIAPKTEHSKIPPR